MLEISACSLVVRDLAAILMLQFCRQIGRKASTVAVPGFLGKSTMYDQLIRSSCVVPRWKAERNCMTCGLTVFQAAL